MIQHVSAIVANLIFPLKVSRLMQDSNNITSLSQANWCCVSTMWPCSLKCTVYACDYANERTVTWLSFMAICRSACDRSRSCQQRSLWDIAVMNLSSPRTDVFSVSWREWWQLFASALVSCGNFHTGSFQETRSGQSVNIHTLSTWNLSNFIMVNSTCENHFLKTARWSVV